MADTVSCLSGERRRDAPPIDVPSWFVKPPTDESSDDEAARSAPPARALFDIRGCEAPQPRPVPDTDALLSEEIHVELGEMLSKLGRDAEAGSSPLERMTGVTRIVLAWLASWLKPAQAASPAAADLPGA